MADDAAGAVRRTPRPAPAVPELWWSPTTGLYRQTRYAGLNRILTSEHRQVIGGVPHAALPNDAARLVLDDPETRRPVVLLRADDCDCGPPYADCMHGPEPVDALDLVVWLHAESEWWLGQYKHDVVLWRQQVTRVEGERDAARADVEELGRENRRLQRTVGRLPWRQRDYDRARLELRKLNDAMARKNRVIARLRAALQGDQPTEPRHELVLKSGLSGCTGACSCGTWHGGGRHEPPSRVAYRWDAEHLTSLPLEQPAEPDERLAGMARPAEGVQLIADAFGIGPGEAAAQLRDAIRAAAWIDLDEPGQPTGEADRG